MTSELFIGQGRPRPKLFLAFLLLFLILGSCLASAVTGADYVRGNGGATAPDDRAESAPTAFSAADDRCILVAAVADDVPQTFWLWRLRPSASDMSVTVLPADKVPPGSGTSLAGLFGDGGRAGCEAVCAALARARMGSPAHYVVLTNAGLRALSEQAEAVLPPAPTEEADARLWGERFAALCKQVFTPTRADRLRDDFTALVNAADTDLSISHFTAYEEALTALAAENAGQRCTVFIL
ncbi:MAG: hypothetical protein IKI63_05145 [Clostridia bacterium]|nr:hypothetical protein [Clostridia bacterium]